MALDSDGDDYENLASLLAVAMAAFAKYKAHYLLLVLVEGKDSRRLRHIVVDARDRRERGGKQPSSREAHTARFSSPHLQSSICVCAEMLWHGELVRIRSRAIAVVDYFSLEIR